MTVSDKHKEGERRRQRTFRAARKAEGKKKCHWYLTAAAKKAVDKFINQLKEK